MEEFTAISVFSGIGGDTLAAQWAGFKTIIFVENDGFCQQILKKHWPQIPIWEDIDDFKAKKYKGVTLIYGGDPCQPSSTAGQRRGSEDDRYKWPEMLRVIHECQPSWVVSENPTGRLSMDFYHVLSNLESEGYETEAFVIPACAVNAPHRRDRVYIVAHRDGIRCDHGRLEGQRIQAGNKSCVENRQCAGLITNSDCGRQQQSERDIKEGRRRAADSPRPLIANAQRKGLERAESKGQIFSQGCSPEYYTVSGWQEDWIEVATTLCGVDDGLPDRVARLRALGNAQVPQQIYPIFKGIVDIENTIHNTPKC